MSAFPGCPFCGKNNAAIDTLNYPSGKHAKFRVQCQECLVATHWCDTEKQAWSSWNTRAEVPQQAKGRQKPVNAIIGADVFVYQGILHVRNPQTGQCFCQSPGGAKRVKKADFVKTYSDCLAICSAELKAAAGAGA